MSFEVSIEVETPAPGVEVGALAALARTVLEGEGREAGTGVSCLLTDDPAIRTLNRQFRGVDEPTDVLAFPNDTDDDFIEAEATGLHLGDIAISVETAAVQAGEAGCSLDDELAHLLVHGILHLCGYDHVESEGEAARMRAREERYLSGAAVHDHAG